MFERMITVILLFGDNHALTFTTTILIIIEVFWEYKQYHGVSEFEPC